MKMSKLEKRFVNRRKKAQNNVNRIHNTLSKFNTENIKYVLEIGCGIGLVSAYLAHEHGFNVYGTDYDPDEIHLAKEFNRESEKLHFQVEDASKLSFADNSIDLLISQNVFHHIPNWVDAVAEIKRVLNLGGYLVWFDLVIPSLLKKIFSPITKNYGLYTISDIQSEFDKTGFNIIQQDKVVHGPFGHYEMVLIKE